MLIKITSFFSLHMSSSRVGAPVVKLLSRPYHKRLIINKRGTVNWALDKELGLRRWLQQPSAAKPGITFAADAASISLSPLAIVLRLWPHAKSQRHFVLFFHCWLVTREQKVKQESSVLLLRADPSKVTPYRTLFWRNRWHYWVLTREIMTFRSWIFVAR